MIIRTAGNLIDISPDGQTALPKPIRKLLEPELSYIYIQHHYGFSKIDYGGVNVTYEPRKLYRYDTKGRMICAKGFIPRITNVLQLNNIEYAIVNKDPPRKRLRCYEENWEL